MAPRCLKKPGRDSEAKQGTAMLRVGQRVHVTRALKFNQETTIPPGERGTVILSDPTIGQTHIKLDRAFPGLAGTDNCIYIIPPDQEVADCVEQLDAEAPRLTLVA
jgi:hypothetical protein